MPVDALIAELLGKQDTTGVPDPDPRAAQVQELMSEMGGQSRMPVYDPKHLASPIPRGMYPEPDSGSEADPDDPLTSPHEDAGIEPRNPQDLIAQIIKAGDVVPLPMNPNTTPLTQQMLERRMQTPAFQSGAQGQQSIERAMRPDMMDILQFRRP